MTEDFNENSSAEKADENQKPAKHASSDRKTLESLARKIALTPIARQEPFAEPVEKAEHMTGREMMEAIEKTRKKKREEPEAPASPAEDDASKRKSILDFFPFLRRQSEELPPQLAEAVTVSPEVIRKQSEDFCTQQQAQIMQEEMDALQMMQRDYLNQKANDTQCITEERQLVPEENPVSADADLFRAAQELLAEKEAAAKAETESLFKAAAELQEQLRSDDSTDSSSQT